MWTMWNAPSDRDYYEQFSCAEPEEDRVAINGSCGRSQVTARSMLSGDTDARYTGHRAANKKPVAAREEAMPGSGAHGSGPRRQSGLKRQWGGLFGMTMSELYKLECRICRREIELPAGEVHKREHLTCPHCGAGLEIEWRAPHPPECGRF